MSEHIVYASDATFGADVLNADLPVLVDFWAEWCGPCRAIAPILDVISAEYAGRLRVVKVDIEASPNTPQKYGVRGVPTLMLFKDGQVVSTKVGALSQGALVSFIDSNI